MSHNRLNPQWSIVVTHLPTGMSVKRTSEFYRNRRDAENSAIRHIKAKLFILSPKDSDLKIEYFRGGVS